MPPEYRSEIAEAVREELRGAFESRPKVGLEWKTLVAILGGVAGILSTAGILLSLVYMTRGDAETIHRSIEGAHTRELNAHIRVAGHSVAIERVSGVEKDQEKQQAKLDALHENVIRIGERLNVRGMKGSE